MSVNSSRLFAGYEELRKGGIVHIANEGGYSHAGAMVRKIANREYHLMPGFAELALSTGADIVPMFCMCRNDGRIHATFLEPLVYDFGSSATTLQIERLVTQFAAFLENSWRNYPASIKADLINHHLTLS